jgi:hypothetical protein
MEEGNNTFICVIDLIRINYEYDFERKWKEFERKSVPKWHCREGRTSNPVNIYPQDYWSLEKP